MSSARKKIAAMLTAVASISGLAIVAAPSASAASATTTSTAAYGCSGSQIDSYPVKLSGGTTWGTMYLYYDSATGRNCAATVKNSTGYAGTNTGTEICLQVNGGKQTCDNGNYSSYAGPISVAAAGKCITISGAIANPASTEFATGFAENVHCG